MKRSRLYLLLIGAVAVCAVCLHNSERSVSGSNRSGGTTAVPTSDPTATIPEPGSATSGSVFSSVETSVAPEESKIASDLDRIFADKTDLEARLAAVRELGRALSPNERFRIYQYLRQVSEASPETHHVKNDLMNVLALQSETPRDFSALLASMYHNSDQDPVIRDYALQHLAAWHEGAPKTDLGFIVATLADAASKKETSYSGTALLGLDRIRSDSDSASDLTSLCKGMTAALLRDSEANLQARIAAAQLAGRLPAPELAADLSRLARDAKTPSMLRIAALAVVRIGPATPEAKALMAEFAQSDDPRLRRAALGSSFR